jgi:hypothetical protein
VLRIERRARFASSGSPTRGTVRAFRGSMKPALTCVFIAGVIGLMGADACGNECNFYQRCDGNTLELCGGGVDQLIGREVQRVPCEAPNPACVELEGGEALCATSATPCDVETYVGRCENDVAFACNGTWNREIAMDCSEITGPNEPYECRTSTGVGSAHCE